jgi:hypothetical protein
MRVPFVAFEIGSKWCLSFKLTVKLSSFFFRIDTTWCLSPYYTTLQLHYNFIYNYNILFACGRMALQYCLFLAGPFVQTSLGTFGAGPDRRDLRRGCQNLYTHVC